MKGGHGQKNACILSNEPTGGGDFCGGVLVFISVGKISLWLT